MILAVVPALSRDPYPAASLGAPGQMVLSITEASGYGSLLSQGRRLINTKSK
jgi:hypothetical protein